jgi:hypothetical protein
MTNQPYRALSAIEQVDLQIENQQLKDALRLADIRIKMLVDQLEEARNNHFLAIYKD